MLGIASRITHNHTSQTVTGAPVEEEAARALVAAAATLTDDGDDVGLGEEVG